MFDYEELGEGQILTVINAKINIQPCPLDLIEGSIVGLLMSHRLF